MSLPDRGAGVQLDHEDGATIEWIQKRIKLIGFNDISKLWNHDEHTSRVKKFLREESSRCIFATVDRDMDNELLLSVNTPPEQSPGRIDVAYFIKEEGSILTMSNIDDLILFGTFAMHQTASSVLNIMEHVFYPNIFHTTDWNESSKRELSGLYHRFMASLTESANEETGRTSLYLPFKDGIKSELDRTSVGKDLLQQLEGIAIHWTRQIKGLLSSHEHVLSSQSQGPIEEINYWKSRARNLSSISDQLQSEEVQAIVRFLNQYESKYVQPVAKLKNSIQVGLKEAQNVVKFLSILQEPCEQLSQLEPENIPKVFLDLMNCTRLIYTHSSNYNTFERVSDLLRRISSEIVRQCSTHISLDKIYYGEAVEVEKVLMGSIACVQKWKSLYNRTAVTINKAIRLEENDGMKQRFWQLDDETIFAETDAFSQRCEDLIDVCKSKYQFVTNLCGYGKDQKSPAIVAERLLGGLTRPDVEKTIDGISSIFASQMDRLDHLSYNILDATNSHWHEDYKNFKTAMKDLDTMLINIINKAFDGVQVVQTSITLLLSFHHLAIRPAIQQCVSSKAGEVKSLFKKQCQSIRQEFDDFHRNPPLRMNEPCYAGAALWANGLICCVDDSWSLLKDINILEERDLNELSGLVNDFQFAIFSYQSQKYSTWLETFATLDNSSFQELLNQALLRKTDKALAKNAPSFITMNFDQNIISIFTEAQFWDKLHNDDFNVPSSILGICHQREGLRLLRERVMILVRAFNNLLEDLEGIHGLYTDCLKRLEKKLRPGFAKLTWCTRQVIIEKFVQNSVEEVKQIHDQVKSFHKKMSCVRYHCRLMSSMTILKVDVNSVYRGKDFEKQQMKQREEVKVSFASHYEQIKQELKELNGYFSKGTLDVKAAWVEHVSRVDSSMYESLLCSVSTSLHTLSDIVSGHVHSGGSHAIFTIEVMLKNGNIECRPSMIEVTNSINVVAKELIGVTKFMSRLSTSNLENDHIQSKFQGSTFFDEISSNRNILDSIVEIMQGTATCVSSVGMNILLWEKYRSLWDMDKESFVRRYSKTKDKSFDSEIGHYQNVEVTIKRESSTVFLHFVQLNFTALKATLLSHSNEFQEKLLTLLKRNVVNETSSTLEYFDTNIQILEKPINSIEALCEISELLDAIDVKSDTIASSFEPLERAYKTLYRIDKNRITPGDEEMLKKLRPKYENLMNEAMKVKSKLEKRKIVIKNEFQNIVSNHKDQMKNICKQVDDHLTTNSSLKDCAIMTWTKSILSDINEYFSNETELLRGLNFFGMGFPDSENVRKAENDVRAMNMLVDESQKWNVTFDDWLKSRLGDLDIDEMEKISCKVVAIISNVHRKIKNWRYWIDFQDKLKLFQSTLPLIKCLLCEGLRERHWIEIGDLVNKNLSGLFQILTLRDLYSLGLQRHLTIVEEITSKASKELGFEQTLDAIRDRLYGAKFSFQPYHDTFKISSFDELVAMIEEDCLLLQSMKSSVCGSTFGVELENLENKFSIISELIDCFRIMQHQWLYLEKIFIGSPCDIDEKLPRESDFFLDLNEKYKGIVADFHIKEYLVSMCNGNLIEKICELTLQMEGIQKSLDLYLDNKRRMFPRFYFLSDDDLLDLIGVSSEPNLVNKHIAKCFEGVASLVIESEANVEGGGSDIIGVKSIDQEFVAFTAKVSVQSSIEVWLQKVNETLQNTLRLLLNNCVSSMKRTPLEVWLNDWQGQLLLTSSSIAWTKACERALSNIHSGKDKQILVVNHKRQLSLLSRLIKVVREPQQENFNRAKIVALITSEVHKRDVIEMLMRSGCQSLDDYSWYSQLRFYLGNSESEGRCTVRQTFCYLPYGYEYQGNNGRLVITPLTDRCILSLITAKFLHRGGNPIGPAGTGKTETVKDLGKNLAYFCIVLNCSEELDFKSIGRTLSGLAQSGCWGCFDEFNRMKVEVLSVVSIQISTILSNIRRGQLSCEFLGTTIKIDSQFGIFVTMNPNYSGRSQLPDNLKVLMRPIAMMSPDFNVIAEVVLSAEGFVDARILAKKIITLYNLMQEQFSKQPHYDYGLRSIKCVLVMAGIMKRSLLNNLDEESILVRAVKCMNEPKFPPHDLQLFLLILDDLFPNHCNDCHHTQEFQNAIKLQFKKNDVQQPGFLLEKTLQLADSMSARQCNMLIGPTYSGKTAIWRNLSNARQSLPPDSKNGATLINTYIINPKALNPEELFGSYVMATNEWFDGVLASVFKSCSEQSNPEVLKWIVLDGPVDPLWIESMNSVMDDNKILTLANGDRIPLTASMSLLFEVENLLVASPATVSRAGMIFIENNNAWKSILSSWLHKMNNETSLMEELCEKYLVPMIEFKKHHCKESPPIPDTVVIKNFIHFCDTFLPHQNKEKEDDEKIEKWFFFCAIWAVGGALNERERIILDRFTKDIGQHFLPARSIFDYYVDPKSNEYESWESKSPNIIHFPSSFYQFTVPTQNTVRYSFLINALLNEDQRVLLTGHKAVGKTQLITSVLSGAHKKSVSSAIMNLSTKMTSYRLQQIMAVNFEKHAKGQLSPITQGTKLVLFIDDLSNPEPVSITNPCKPPLELIRHFICHGGWYDRKRCVWQSIVDTNVVAASSLSAIENEGIPARLQSQFYTINMSEPNQHFVTKIFQAILDIGFKSVDSEIKATFGNIAAATHNLYVNCKQQFRCSPTTKNQYDFSLRDVYHVAQGMLLASGDLLDSKISLFKLWIHECLRSFSDRFIEHKSGDDGTAFSSLLKDVLKQHLAFTQVQSLTIDEPLFTSLHTESKRQDDKFYLKVEETVVLRDFVVNKLNEYNDHYPNMKMDLVIFDDALKHLCRIHRILQLERGHMLFMGINGSGRESLTRLAAYIANVNFYTTGILGEHDVESFREKLRSLCFSSGMKNQRNVLLVKDEKIQCDACLEQICNVFVSGSLQGLFTKEDKRKVCEELMNEVVLTGDEYEISDDILWHFFVQRTRKNLHFVYATSHLSPTFHGRRKLHAALFDLTKTNFFQKWPKSALFQVAQRVLPHHSEDLESSVSNSLSCIHDDVVIKSANMNRNKLVTPSNYFELIFTFKKKLKENQIKLDKEEMKLRDGLDKLSASNAKVAEMKLDLRKMHDEVTKSQKECDIMLETIVSKQRETEHQRGLVEENSRKIEEEEKECLAIAEEAEMDLAIALPALESALGEVDKLDKSAITEIKVYSNPPHAVEKVLSCVMILLGKPQDWASAKRALGDSNFLHSLKTFDKDNVSESILGRVKKVVKSPAFGAEEIGKVSRAASALCQWCHAIHRYANIIKKVKPKRARLKAAEKELKRKRQDLSSVQQALEDSAVKLKNLRNEYDYNVEKKNQFKSEAINLENKLSRAEKLLLGFKNEHSRWERSIAEIGKQRETNVGDTIICSSFLSYAGPFDNCHRSDFLSSWISCVSSKGLSVNGNLKICKLLSNDVQIMEWNLQGLPKDDFYTENAIITTKSSKWPFIVDPQGQGLAWIRSLHSNSLIVVNDGSGNEYLREIERAILCGHPVLLTMSSTQLDPSLNSILILSTKTSNKSIVKWRNKEIRYNQNFSFYLQSYLVDPCLPPDLVANTKIINFSVTQNGLEEQLLEALLHEEEPTLESQKSAVITKLADCKRKLYALEDKILSDLSASAGSFIENTSLVNAIQSSMATVDDINHQLHVAKGTEMKLNNVRETFRGAAKRSSTLFSCLQDMSNINCMYQYGLESYLVSFRTNIATSKNANKHFDSSENCMNRVEQINTHHTMDIFNSTSIGLFPQHKVLFTLQLCLRILNEQRMVSSMEVEYFCNGRNISGNSVETETFFSWLSEEANEALSHLDIIIDGLCTTVKNNEEEWRLWFRSERPETSSLPGNIESKLTLFQKLCVLRTFRIDRVPYALNDFISATIGQEYISSPSLDLGKITNDTPAKVPLIFLLSSGADPTDHIIKLAKHKSAKLVQISLGQGQGKTAIQALKKGSRDGSWVLLSNCHLMPSWMKDLENVIEDCYQSENNINTSYRLWLTTFPTQNFPIKILKWGIKMVHEAPSGLRANLKKLSNFITSDDFEKSKTTIQKKLLISLIWFHSILLERRKFKSQGFIIPYEFNDSDFLMSFDLILALLEKNRFNLSMKGLQNLLGDVVYGGKITESFDSRILRVHLSEIFSENGLNQEWFKPSDLPEYRVKFDTDIASFRSFIDALPSMDDPALFGQHTNSEMTSRVEEVNCMLSNISKMNNRSKKSFKTNTVEKNEFIFATLDRIPVPFRKDDLNLYQKKCDPKDAVQVFLGQELQRYNEMLNLIHRTKGDIHKLTKGLILPCSQLDTMIEDLSHFRIPVEWGKYYDSNKPLGSWVDDLCKRVDQLNKWMLEGEPNVVWLGGFMYPSSYLTSVLQKHARTNFTSISEMNLKTSWEFNILKKDTIIDAKPEDGGIYVCGMVLEGALWKDCGHLADQVPIESQSPMPIVHFKPTESRRRVKDDKVYECPVYSYPGRIRKSMMGSSYILSIDLNTGEKSANHWTKGGVALLLSSS